ncbi:MAG: NAD-dependent epimerase/dehydratase family protein [Rhodospirillales bacterium]|nr:NAD-dependent epimerase/dehydratase family protein [Rhodospirillales bacterium]MBO6786009.1 NAD-dependent epimerase/dehydratase family protein [Rhodospirillales bacterium]
MLEHGDVEGSSPDRLVVIGAGGFVGGTIADIAEKDGVEVLRLGRSDVDLTSQDAPEKLAGLLRPGDAIVAAAASAPVKNLDMLRDNIVLFGNIAAAVQTRAKDIVHVLNVSSDAIYADEPVPLTEETPAAPESYHGIMHLAREVHMKTVVPVPLASLRPTLIYGAGDPHNGYGPNKFRRQAAAGEEIVLFGEGEERRDHVLIDDVADLAWLMVKHRSTGALNAVTGDVSTFRQIAELVVGLFPDPVAIKGSQRTGPMPHNGYRPFDNKAVSQAFPDFRFTPIEEGLKRAHMGEFGGDS